MKRPWTEAAGILLTAILASCTAVGSSSPEEGPTRAASKEREAPRPRTAVPPAWWTLYGDPALTDLVERILAEGGDLSEAARRVRSALALVDPGEKAALPWELRLWETLRGKGEAGEDLETAARASLASQAVRTYLAVGEARARKDLALDRVRVASGSTGRGRKPGEGRALSPLERERRTRVESDAGVAYRSERERLERAIRQLEMLLGRYPRAEMLLEIRLPSPSAGAFEAVTAVAASDPATREWAVLEAELRGLVKASATTLGRIARERERAEGPPGTSRRILWEERRREWDVRLEEIGRRRALLETWAHLAATMQCPPGLRGGEESR